MERPGFKLNYKIKRQLYSGRTKFQKIDIFDLEVFGKVLFLDNDFQICESDTVIYDKAMVDPIFEMNKDAKRVMILGGGDGGVLREVLTHPVEEAIMVELDKEVVDICKQYLPDICKNAFKDNRTKLIIDDAGKVIKQERNLDAIISDLTDPEKMLEFGGVEFYEQLFLDIKNALADNGILTLQVGSHYEHEMVHMIETMLKKHFKEVSFRPVFIPSYVEPWIFGYARK